MYKQALIPSPINQFEKSSLLPPRVLNYSMAGPAQEQALPLLALANNHGDLAVKLSSLKQVKDILLSAEPSHAAELFPYLVELQSSPETLVRKYLLE